jgi:hypothetical protein
MSDNLPKGIEEVLNTVIEQMGGLKINEHSPHSKVRNFFLEHKDMCLGECSFNPEQYLPVRFVNHHDKDATLSTGVMPVCHFCGGELQAVKYWRVADPDVYNEDTGCIEVAQAFLTVLPCPNQTCRDSVYVRPSGLSLPRDREGLSYIEECEECTKEDEDV